MRIRADLLAVLLFALLSWACSAHAADAPAQDPDPAASIEDPRRLEQLAQDALAAGDKDAARGLYGKMLERQEVSVYLDYKKTLRNALVAERMGENADAEALYRKAFDEDILRVIQVLRIMSVHPDRERLAQEAYAHLDRLVDEVRAGGSPPFYVTSKGEVRRLEKMTVDQVLALAEKGEMARYCYVDALDFSGRTELPELIQL